MSIDSVEYSTWTQGQIVGDDCSEPLLPGRDRRGESRLSSDTSFDLERYFHYSSSFLPYLDFCRLTQEFGEGHTSPERDLYAQKGENHKALLPREFVPNGEPWLTNEHYLCTYCNQSVICIKTLCDNLVEDCCIVRPSEYPTFVTSWPTPTGADRPMSKTTGRKIIVKVNS